MNKPFYNILLYALIIGWFSGGCKSPQFHTAEEVAYSYKQVHHLQNAPNCLDTFLEDYKLKKDSIMNVVIGTTAIPLTKAQPESTMGNFIVDAQLRFAQTKDQQVVASVLNYGGIRIPYLATGNITVGNIYEIMPFDNTLVIAEVPGKTIKELCALIAQKKGWPIAGITFKISATNEAKDIRINNQAVNDHLIYKIALSDYLANGGDHCEFLIQCKRRHFNIFIRDILIEYVKEHQNMQPTLSQRISYE